MAVFCFTDIPQHIVYLSAEVSLGSLRQGRRVAF